MDSNVTWINWFVNCPGSEALIAKVNITVRVWRAKIALDQVIGTVKSD